MNTLTKTWCAESCIRANINKYFWKGTRVTINTFCVDHILHHYLMKCVLREYWQLDTLSFTYVLLVLVCIITYMMLLNLSLFYVRIKIFQGFFLYPYISGL